MSTLEIRKVLRKAEELSVDISPFLVEKTWYKNNNKGFYHADKFCWKLASYFDTKTVTGSALTAKSKLCEECVIRSYTNEEQKQYHLTCELIKIAESIAKQIGNIDGSTKNAIVKSNLQHLEKTLHNIPDMEYSHVLIAKLKSDIKELNAKAVLSEDGKDSIVVHAVLNLAKSEINRTCEARSLYKLVSQDNVYKSLLNVWSKSITNSDNRVELTNYVEKITRELKPIYTSQLLFLANQDLIKENIALSQSEILVKLYRDKLIEEIKVELAYFEEVYSKILSQNEMVYLLSPDGLSATDHYEKAATMYWDKVIVKNKCGFIMPKNVAVWLNSASSYGYDNSIHIVEQSDQNDTLITAVTLWEPRDWGSPYKQFNKALEAARAV